MKDRFAHEASEDRVETLKKVIDELRTKLASVEAELAGIDRESDVELQQSDILVEDLLPRRSLRPVRDVMLDLLTDLGFLAFSRELAAYSRARYGRQIDSTRFGSLAKNEIDSYIKNKVARPVWLCFGLTWDRFEPIKKLWARSDWPLESRLVSPLTSRIQHLRMTMRLCEIARAENAANEPEMLRIITADHARGLPGVRVRNGEFPLEDWHRIAMEQLAEIEDDDLRQRQDAAVRLRDKPEAYQLFGAPDVLDSRVAGEGSMSLKTRQGRP